MAPLSGLFGSAVITAVGTVPGTAAIIGVGEWTLDIGNNVVDTTAFGDAWRKIINSVREWSVSFSGNRDTDTSQTTLRNAMLGGSVVSLRLYDSPTTYYSGSGILTGLSPSISFDGKGEDSWDLDGDGALTYT